MPWLAAATAVALLALTIGLSFRRPPAAAAEVRFEISTPPTMEAEDLASLALSPDGQKLVYAAPLNGEPHLWIRELDSVEPRVLPGTSHAQLPFWSPDSSSVGFFAEGQLKRLDLDGGLVHSVTDAIAGVGGTWNRDGVMLLSPNPASPIFRIGSGGNLTPVTELAGTHAGHGFPHFLPDGKRFLFFVQGSSDSRGVYLSELGNTTTAKLFDAESPAAYAAGHLLFVRQQRILAWPFDIERGQLIGMPKVVAEGAAIANRLGFYSTLTGAANGTIAYRTGSLVVGRRQFEWLDRSGNHISMVGNPDDTAPVSPNLSPDGRHVALLRRGDGNADVWLLETRRGVLTRLTDHVAEDVFPVWSHDGTQVVFSSNRGGRMGLYRRPATGPGIEELLVGGPGNLLANDMSRDGRFLLYQRGEPKTRGDLWVRPMKGDDRDIPVAQTAADERDGQFSPDGTWIAYQSNRSGRFEVYVQPFPGPGAPVPVSTGGGAQVRWRSDGQELYYVTLDGMLMAVPMTIAKDARSIDPGVPVPLFRTGIGRVLRSNPGAQYVVADNGRRFLMNNLVVDGASTSIQIILNWQATP